MSKADYRKINDGSHSSSTYHKKDGTAVRQILGRDAKNEEMQHRIDRLTRVISRGTSDPDLLTKKAKDARKLVYDALSKRH